MGIRKQENRYRKKLSTGTLVLGLAVLSMVTNVRNAWADPHGMFYTAIGQQQLFFNVLAALDQADYVETAFDREARRKAREAVSAQQPFSKETESGGRFTKETEVASDSGSQGSTQPGTPTLLNRAVTLDGADLYTDQLVREFGAESARRNSAAELLQTLCDFGFGIEECDDDETNRSIVEKVEAKERKKAATINDPLEWAAMPFLNGVMGAFNSGNLARIIDNPHPDNLNPLAGQGNPPGPAVAASLTDEEYRAGKIKWPDIFGYEPLAYSEQIAAWRKIVESRPDYQQHSNMIDEQIMGVIGTFGLPQGDAYPFSEILFMPNGETRLIGLNYTPQQCGNTIPCLKAQQDIPSGSIAKQNGMTVSKYVSLVNEMVIAGGNRALTEIGIDAAARIRAQQEIIENDGVLAKTHLETQSGALSNYGELSVRIDSPVAAREASIYGIPNVLGQLATSQQASALTGLDKPGAVQLVKRSGTSGSQGSEPPQLQGAIEAGGPQVAGALDLLFKPGEVFFDKEKDPTSPSANIISPILEFGARHALRVITAGKWRPGTTAGITCGFTCD